MDTNRITVHTERRSGRSALLVRTAHGEVAAEWTPAGWRVSALLDGRPACEGIEMLADLEASPRWTAWLARNAEAAAEARAALAAAELRAQPIPRLVLQGGPATGGARWVAAGTVGVCVATRRELTGAIGRREIDLATRLAVAKEILARPIDRPSIARDEARRKRDRRAMRIAFRGRNSFFGRQPHTAALDASRRPGWSTCAEARQYEVALPDRVGAERLLARLGAVRSG